MQPAFDITDRPAVDVLVIPGGVVQAEMELAIRTARQMDYDWQRVPA